MRRVSFAVALLQEPELLILDEPTVGVDPLLRERYLFNIILLALNAQGELQFTKSINGILEICFHQ